MLLSQRTLQTKLLVSVSLIVSFVVVCLTSFVIYTEKHRSETREVSRISNATEAMNTRLGHLIYGRNWRYLMITLNAAKRADPSMLFFSVTDVEGNVLASNLEGSIGEKLELTRVHDSGVPLHQKEFHSGGGWLSIYLVDYAAGEKGEKEVIFEGVHDILYMGKFMGRLWVGYSRKAMNRYLKILSMGMLGTGAMVLGVSLALIYLVIRSHMVPMKSFVRQIATLDLTRENLGVSECLSSIPVRHQPGETQDVRHLKQAFEHLLGQFASTCRQLEEHKDNLERMVGERTRDLYLTNTRLSREVQERQEIEARLLTVQKLEAISTLAGGIAHEFNNLFMAITGYATLIQKRAGQDDLIGQKAEKIRQLVDTGSQSVQQLLGFARAGKYAPGPLNLNEVIRGSLIILSHSRKDLGIKAQYHPGLWTVMADRSQMEQVVMNLLLNASEAMPERGEVSLTTENLMLESFQVSLSKKVSGPFICLSVKDRGTGIASDDLSRIFDPFFTTRETRSGMGLASAFGIVENHGGFITVESTPGRGSLFKVFLPRLSPPSANA